MTVTPYPTVEELQGSFTDLLDPLTRWRIPPPGEGPAVLVNQKGFDHWVGHIGAPYRDSDGRAHQYIVSWPDAGTAARGRSVAKASALRWGVQITVAGGDPRRARWALDRLRPALEGTRLLDPEGRPITAPLIETFGEGFGFREDDEVSPTRWYTIVRYATSAHRPRSQTP